MISLPTFKTLRTRVSLHKANYEFVEAVTAGADRGQEMLLGTPGGDSRLTTWRMPRIDLWCAPGHAHNRSWNALGIGDPFAQAKLAPMVEINFPRAASSSASAGLALVAANGVTAFAHTGRIGGGKRGVGMVAFKAFHPLSEPVMVDDRRRDVYFLGDLSNREELAQNVSDFVHSVADFKAGLDLTLRTPSLGPDFSPEFDGDTSYELGSTNRTATYTHGRVVNGLYQALQRLGIHAQRNRLIDLFAAPTRDRLGVIFEIKTACDTQNLYTCVGQLILLTPDPAWMQIAVLPGPLPDVTRKRLSAAGISTLEYTLDASGWKPTFPGIDPLVHRLRRAV